MLIQNSAEFNIDLNVKDKDGMTAFHNASKYCHSKIAELDIDLNAKDKDGMTD